MEEFAGKPTALAAYLGVLMVEAGETLGSPPPADLFDRFLAWVRPTG